MALPSILSYPMPGEPDLPANRAAWRPDPKRAVLLIHDMQQYFVDAFNAEESPVPELLANIRKLRAQCAALGIPVVYSAQPGGQSPERRGLLSDFWGPGMDDGPYQKKIVEALAPGEHDIVVTKWRYSAFQKTELLDILRQRGRDQLIVCGIYAHIGCLMTACEAFMQDVQSFFVADAVADFSADKHRMALAYAADRCAVAITTRRLIEELAGLGDSRAEPESGPAADPSVQAPHEEGGHPLTRQAVRVEVAGLLQEHPSRIADDDNLIHIWGLDSIRIMSLIERWRRGGAEVSFAELAERPTLADWWQLLSSRMSRSLPNSDYFTV